MSRVSRLRATLAPGTTLLVSDPVNIRYLCGFTGSYGVLTVGPDDAVLWTDSRYELHAAAQVVDAEVRVITQALAAAKAHAANSHTTLLVELDHMSVSAHRDLGSPAGLTGAVEALRLVKDPGEIALIGQACSIATAALAQVLPDVRLGMTERALAVALERTMVDLGAEAPAFESIVAFGANSAVPHHEPSDRELAAGELVKIDFGAQVGGYHSDCTRTFTAGPAAGWQREMHAEVMAAQALGASAVRHGAALRDIDTLVRGRLADTPGAFRHGLGHGVGLRIHEDPFVRHSSDGRLAHGMVVTVEPGVYLADRGGVRIEDTLVVTADGCENLTDLPHDLIDIL